MKSMNVAVSLLLTVLGISDAIFIFPPYRPPPVYRPPPPPPTPPYVPPPTTLPAFDPGFSCQGQPDGVYDMGCSQEFVTCRNGQAITHRCPGNLVYDKDSGKCLGRAYVLVCGGTPTAPSYPPTAEAPPETTPYYEPETTRRPRGRKNLNIEINVACKGLPSGIYGHRCSSDYVFCSGGRPSWHHCPAPLKFDPVTFKCVAVNKIRSCHGGHHSFRPHFEIGEAYE